jgi:hypothetical protein
VPAPRPFSARRPGLSTVPPAAGTWHTESMRPLFAVLLCALPAAASAVGLEGASASAGAAFSAELSAPSFDFRAFAPRPQESPRAEPAAPLYEIELAPLLGNIQRTASLFDAGGVRVHVFGDKSRNRNEWFVGFAPEGGVPVFRKGKKMLHWYLIDRTVEFAINGIEYRAYVEGSVRHRLSSRLVVERKGKARGEAPAFSSTIGELSQNAYLAGYPVRLNGAEYRLLYSENFNEDSNGDYAGLTGERSIVLMYRDGTKYSGLHWFEHDIPTAAMRVFTPQAVGVDDERGPGALSVGLRLAPGRRLQIDPR